MSLRPLRDVFAGAMVGFVSMLPGASGATIAVVFGIYDRLVGDLANIRSRLLKDLRFFLTVAVGVALGMLICAKGLDFLLSRCEVPMMFLFVTLILMQVPDIMRMGEDGDEGYAAKDAVPFVFGFLVMMAVLAAGLLTGSDGPEEDGALMMFFAGIVLAVSKMAPGISGSTVLLALGLFGPFNHALSVMDFSLLIPIGIGLVLGVLGFSRVMDMCFRRSRRATYSAILGLTVGSAVTVFVQGAVDVTGTDMMVQCAVCAVLGIVFGYALSRIARRYTEE